MMTSGKSKCEKLVLMALEEENHNVDNSEVQDFDSDCSIQDPHYEPSSDSESTDKENVSSTKKDERKERIDAEEKIFKRSSKMKRSPQRSRENESGVQVPSGDENQKIKARKASTGSVLDSILDSSSDEGEPLDSKRKRGKNEESEKEPSEEEEWSVTRGKRKKRSPKSRTDQHKKNTEENEVEVLHRRVEELQMTIEEIHRLTILYPNTQTDIKKCVKAARTCVVQTARCASRVSRRVSEQDENLRRVRKELAEVRSGLAAASATPARPKGLCVGIQVGSEDLDELEAARKEEERVAALKERMGRVVEVDEVIDLANEDWPEAVFERTEATEESPLGRANDLGVFVANGGDTGGEVFGAYPELVSLPVEERMEDVRCGWMAVMTRVPGRDTTEKYIFKVVPSDRNEMFLELPSVSTNTTRKRIRKENTWKKNVRKNKRAKGEEYTNTKGVIVLAKTINTQYRCPCNEKRHEKIEPERQRILFSKYYGLSNFNLQSSYLCSLVNVVIKARSCKQNANDVTTKAREFSRLYHLPDMNGRQIRVCKSFFKHVL
ncbi:unnamed protein product [Diabrotica balteata]|uniref:Uncharacterized protein n=1 Tax=Diabrotica balteata TaxID=107213 RepID=A0A9N9T8B2_DIABA|nr:unnamed protein product [Diabrotica balteata]